MIGQGLILASPAGYGLSKSQPGSGGAKGTMTMIFTPDNFRADWYGWITNQWARVFNAIALSIVAVFTYWGALLFSTGIGEYPYRLPLAGLLVLGYIAYELRRGQGETFKVWDSCDDTMFWCYGVFMVLGTLHEVERTMLTLEPNVEAIFAILGLISFHSVVGVGIRVVQACRQ